MINIPYRPSMILAGLLAAASCLVPPAARAGSEGAMPKDFVLPPMSYGKGMFFKSHPDAYAQFLSKLAHRPADVSAQDGPPHDPPEGGPWQGAPRAPAANLCNPILLTDGTVLVASGDTPDWYKLTPDINGDYAHGTWSQVASLPVINGTQYAPLYHATGLLPDGRVIIMGGEYDGTNYGVWTNQGAIYDPVANSWTPVPAPLGAGWNQIGDAQSVMLADGTFMLASCCGYPDVDATLNPNRLDWYATGAPRYAGSYQDEQGYELLPNGKVLTIDVWSTYPNGNPSNAEVYDPKSGRWISAGNTPVSLVDPEQCGNYEIGPAVVRGDGTVVAFGGNTGCVTGATNDPTAIYDSKLNSWTAGPYVPAVCGSDSATSCSLADAPAALLPDGNVLFAASSGYGNAPTHFFEYSSTNSITQVPDTLFWSKQSGAYYYNFLVLPTGQILSTDFSKTAEIYTPAGNPVAAWAPIVLQAPKQVAPGGSYTIVGEQLSGRSQGAFYGDDAQMGTNYPLVRIVNAATGHVFYARTFSISTMSVGEKVVGSTRFTVPGTVETGTSYLYVVADGIASQPTTVDVQ